MNKEYAYLSNEEIIVTNEKGKMSKKKIESKDIEKELILENYIEEINRLKNYIQTTLSATKMKYPKSKIFIISILILLESLVLLCFGQFNLFYIIHFAIFDYLAYEIVGFGPLATRKNKKRENALQKELEKVDEVLKKYESKLSNLKSKVYQEEKEQDKDIAQPGEIFSLEKYMDIPDEIYDELNEAYDQGYGKKLKLK